MKTVFASALSLSDYIRAESGAPEAVFDARLSAVYTAAYHVMKAGNKTQWNMVQAACAQFADVKACKVALGSSTLTAAVKRMHAVYLAYGAALSACGVPAMVKGATHEELDVAAGAYASEFATLVTVALTPEAKAVKTEEQKAAEKAEKEAVKAKAEAEAQAAEQARIDAAVADIAAASALTMADMIATVINAVKLGHATVDQLQALSDALDTVAVDVAYVPVADVASIPAHA